MWQVQPALKQDQRSLHISNVPIPFYPFLFTDALGPDVLRLEPTAVLTIYISSAVFAMTVQVQDFRDIKGNTKLGWKTIPIVFPNDAHKTIAVMLLTWLIFLSQFWQLSPAIAAILIGLAGYVGARLIAYRMLVEADKMSFYWYNMSRHKLNGNLLC